MDKIRVLIVDDEVQLAQAFKKKLEQEGYLVTTAATGAEVLPLVREHPFDVAVLDIRLPDADGVDLLSRLKGMEPNLEVVMLTGHASVDTAIKSMKSGAYDYLVKPCKLTELSSVILKAYEKKALREKNKVLEEHLQRIDLPDRFVGDSKPAREVKKNLALVGASDVPVLITGETGTGKELAARAIHAFSKRSGNPFVAINSSTLQETMLESELFGYKRGAFTGAQTDKMGLLEIANRGTFFVDEVGEMTPPIQAKLLRVLETGTFRKLGDTREINVDVRFIFATNKNLEEEVQERRFRKDLFYRVNTFVVVMPPLRQRREDLPLLTEHFLGKLAKGGRRKGLSQGALKAFMEYHWPGNVRELANVLERALLVSADRDEVTTEDLPPGMLGGQRMPGEERRRTSSPPSDNLRDVVREHVEQVLKMVDGNKSEAARILGISRKKLYRTIAGELFDE